MVQRTGQQNRERWSPIEGTYGGYEISSQGRVRRLSSWRSGLSRSGNAFAYLRGPHLIKPVLLKTGYAQVSLLHDGGMKKHSVHRLVAEAFIPNPYSKPVVNHRNGIRDDNRVSNLEWATVGENLKHAYDVLGLIPHQRGAFGINNNARKAVVQRTTSGSVVRKWDAGMDAVRAGFQSSGISRCCKGKAQTHRSFKWTYA